MCTRLFGLCAWVCAIHVALRVATRMQDVYLRPHMSFEDVCRCRPPVWSVSVVHKQGCCDVTSPIDKAFGGPRHRAVFEWFQVRRASTMCCVRSVSVTPGLVCGLRLRGVLVSNLAENRPTAGPKIRSPRPETATKGHKPKQSAVEPIVTVTVSQGTGLWDTVTVTVSQARPHPDACCLSWGFVLVRGPGGLIDGHILLVYFDFPCGCGGAATHCTNRLSNTHHLYPASFWSSPAPGTRLHLETPLKLPAPNRLSQPRCRLSSIPTRFVDLVRVGPRPLALCRIYELTETPPQLTARLSLYHTHKPSGQCLGHRIAPSCVVRFRLALRPPPVPFQIRRLW